MAGSTRSDPATSKSFRVPKAQTNPKVEQARRAGSCFPSCTSLRKYRAPRTLKTLRAVADFLEKAPFHEPRSDPRIGGLSWPSRHDFLTKRPKPAWFTSWCADARAQSTSRCKAKEASLTNVEAFARKMPRHEFCQSLAGVCRHGTFDEKTALT